MGEQQQPGGGDSVVGLECRGRVAVLTIDNDAKLNALSLLQYYDLGRKLQLVAARDDVVVTVILAKGRYFSAGADVGAFRPVPSDPSPSGLSPSGLSPSGSPQDLHRLWLSTFAAFNLNITHAFATHPKILVVGLNGPVVGLSAALIAFADFVYAVPHAFLLTPFSAIGLVAEGGASRELVRRLGPARAHEALIMSKRLTARELQACGFVNDIFPFDKADDAAFRARVLREVDDRLGDHLNAESILEIKKLIRGPDINSLHAQNVNEIFAGIDRFVRGVPQEEFRKLASGEKRHKL